MPTESTTTEWITVTLAYALPMKAWVTVMKLPTGTTAADAVVSTQYAVRIPAFDSESLGYAVFGKSISPTTVLRDGDRLELLRPLIADPKQARRKRARS